jgi:hypothetical protein
VASPLGPCNYNTGSGDPLIGMLADASASP